MSSLSGLSITWLVGLALIFIALVGGGIEVKEIKIPSISIVSRVITFLCGCTLFMLGFAVSNDLLPALKAGLGHPSTEASLASGLVQDSAIKPAPAPKFTSGSASTNLASSGVVPASEQTQSYTSARLTANDIMSRIVDHKFRWDNSRGATGTVLYEKNRLSELTLNQGPVSNDSGNWWLNGDSICVAWKLNIDSNRCLYFDNIADNRIKTSAGIIWSPLGGEGLKQ